MSDNFVCTHCGVRYDFHPGTCNNCSENTVIYDGAGDRREQERKEREKDRLTQKHARSAQKPTRNHTDSKRPRTKDTPKSAPKVRNTSENDFNALFALIGFVIGAGVTFSATKENGVAALIAGAITGYLAGKLYKLIIGIAIGGVALWMIASQNNRETKNELSPNLTKSNPSFTENSQKKLIPNNSGPGFTGRWNEGLAFNLAWPTPREPEYEDGHRDQLERSFLINEKNESFRILITSILPGTCQACASKLSLFVYKKVGNKWFLDAESRDFRTGGKHLYEDSIELSIIGPGRIGLEFNNNGWHQGDTYVTKEIYYFINGDLHKVLENSLIHVYFSGIPQDEAKIEGYWFEKKIELNVNKKVSDHGFYSITLHYTSSDTNKTFETISRFDGEKYKILDLRSVESCAGSLKEFIENSGCKLSIEN